MPKLKPIEEFDAFFGYLAEGASITEACREIGVSTRSVQRRRKSDPEFAARFDEAYELSTQALEREAFRRAADKSDLLLIFLLKARRPNVYRDNVTHEHKGKLTLELRAKAEEFDRRFADRATRVRELAASGLRDR